MQFGNFELVVLSLLQHLLPDLIYQVVLVLQLLILLVEHVLQGLDGGVSGFGHILRLLLVYGLSLVGLRVNCLLHHSILAQILVSHVPLLDLLDCSLLTHSIHFDFLKFLLKHLYLLLEDLLLSCVSVLAHAVTALGEESLGVDAGGMVGRSWESRLVALKSSRDIIELGIEEALHAIVVLPAELFFALGQTGLEGSHLLFK